jgi:hypothetical protein
MKESEMTALRTDARWHAVVQYRTGVETPMNVDIYLEEIGDIHDHIEHGPHWDTVEIVEIRRINHIASPYLTLEQAAELGRRTIHNKP